MIYRYQLFGLLFVCIVIMSVRLWFHCVRVLFSVMVQLSIYIFPWSLYAE